MRWGAARASGKSNERQAKAKLHTRGGPRRRPGLATASQGRRIWDWQLWSICTICWDLGCLQTQRITSWRCLCFWQNCSSLSDCGLFLYFKYFLCVGMSNASYINETSLLSWRRFQSWTDVSAVKFVSDCGSECGAWRTAWRQVGGLVDMYSMYSHAPCFWCEESYSAERGQSGVNPPKAIQIRMVDVWRRPISTTGWWGIRKYRIT